ncbi:hypothetical protein M3573_18880 [Bacillus safensis]|uniref:hypothetical protein n=1 Tax=Bacillus safensis TaxID=561879 RepID=UPI002040288B|nr:hypothetical protein [Bacillus safensis]MCM3140343.1 hypothetical protein [Bacillus safensis]
MLKTFYFVVIAIVSCIFINVLLFFLLGATSTFKMLTQLLQITALSAGITIILMRHGEED